VIVTRLYPCDEYVPKIVRTRESRFNPTTHTPVAARREPDIVTQKKTRSRLRGGICKAPSMQLTMADTFQVVARYRRNAVKQMLKYRTLIPINMRIRPGVGRVGDQGEKAFTAGLAAVDRNPANV